MARLKLYLLGSFRATLDDTLLAGLHSHKGRGLLAYLASQAGDAHQRETLATLLWGEHTEQAARLSLRVELHNLRKVLESVRSGEDGLPCLITSRQQALFRASPDLCWTDSREFDALLAACAAHPHHAIARCPACVERLVQAVALYRGDFLADLTFADSPAFESWRTLQQEHYHRLTLQALGQVSDYYQAQGDFAAAQAAAQRQLDLEPWHEAAHRQVMRCLALTGQRSAALAQYRAAHRILADELGLGPEAETDALHAQIRGGALAPAGDGAAPRQRDTVFAPLTPFVGRVQELRQIGELLGDPACRLLTLIGPGGSGKTRLAQQALARYGSLFRDGAYYVSLNYGDTKDVLSMALAEALGIPLAQADASTLNPLTLQLRHKALLLVLDDCTPMPAVATWIMDLMVSAPALRVVAISRQRLNMRGAWLMRVEGLACCDHGCLVCQTGDEQSVVTATVETCEALQLFLASARRNAPHLLLDADDLRHVRQICHLVEGIPLAVELAAAWLPVLSCQEIAAEIENNFYNVRSWFREGETAFGRLAGALSCQPEAAFGTARTLLGVALASQAWFTCQLDRCLQADQLMRQSLAVLEGQDAPDALAFALSQKGAIALYAGAHAEVRQPCEDALALFQARANHIGMATALGFLAQLALEQGRYDEAERHAEASLTLARSQGNRWRSAFSLSQLAAVAVARGAYENGQLLLREVLAIRQERGDQRGVSAAYIQLGELAAARGGWGAALNWYGQALGIAWRLGQWHAIARSCLSLATVLDKTGQPQEGLLLLLVLREHGELRQRDRKQIADLCAALASHVSPDHMSVLQARAQVTTLDAVVHRHATVPG